MKYFFTFLIALFFLGNSFAQKEKDSLNSAWHNNQLQDSTRLKAVSSLIKKHYFHQNTDSALVLGKQMLKFAKEKLGNTKFEVYTYGIVGNIYFKNKNNDGATESFTKALELALSVKDSLLYAETLVNLGELYYDYDDYTSAYKTFKKSRAFSKMIGYNAGEGWSIDRLGLIHADLGNFEESEKYHIENIKFREASGNKFSLSGAHGNLGRLYNMKGDIPKSLFHWNEGIRIAKEIDRPLYAAKGTSFLIAIYIGEKDYENAIKYLTEYKSLANLKDPVYSISPTLISLYHCQIDYGLGNYAKALNECENCKKIYETNNWELESSLLKSLYEVNKALNRHKVALDYFEQYQLLLDDKKEDEARTEIQNIIFNNQLASDSIAQVQEKELVNITYEEGIRKKNREKNLFLILGLLTLLIAAAYFIISRRISAKERKRLQEVNDLKNALFTNITHEFRTPLTVIKGMTDSLKTNFKNNNPDETENALTMIERNSDNLLHLVNEMLDLSKIESGNMELQLVQTDVIPFLKYLSESFSSYAEDHKINLTIYSEIDSLIMDFDDNKLTSVMSNLLSNAIKFTQEYGKIIVHINKIVEKEKSYLFIKIKDNGSGISKKDLPNVFNRFYQTDASTIRKHEGTGIGLALTKDLIELMNGTITVKSELKKGSEFSIMIPITRDATIKAKVSPKTDVAFPIINKSSLQAKSTPDTNKKAQTDLPLVLIIEDNMDVAHYLKMCLANTYQTLHAVNGNVGIEMALDNIPDIIICDVMMPEKDGFEVCAALKTDERSDHIPIIILTAKVTTEDRLTGLSHGADAYLAKPFNKDELFTRLDQLVLSRKKLINKIKVDGFDILLKKETENPKLQFLQKTIKLIHKNIDDSDFGTSELAEKLRVSESQLYRKIKAITEKSTAVFIRSIRLQYAKEILLNSDKTVSEVAYAVGFSNPSWFSRAFKDEFGFSPSNTSN